MDLQIRTKWWMDTWSCPTCSTLWPRSQMHLPPGSSLQGGHGGGVLWHWAYGFGPSSDGLRTPSPLHLAKGASTQSYNEAILPRTFVCARPTFLASYMYKSMCVCTSTTSSNHVGFLYVVLWLVHVYDVQMYELAFFKWAYYYRWRFKSLKSNGVLQDIHYIAKLFYILIFSA